MQFGVGSAHTPVPDDILRALGQVAVNFGLLEWQLSTLIALLAGGEYAVGRAVVAALSFDNRIDVLVAATKIRASKFPEKDLKTLAARLKDAEDRRNRAFHSQFFGAHLLTGGTVQIKESSRKRKGYVVKGNTVKAADIRADADFIAEVAADVTRAQGEIAGLLGENVAKT